MNRTLTLLILLFLLATAGLAQTLDIELKSQPVKFINPKIYVDSVVDNRDFKEWIVTTKTGNRKQSKLNLAGGVATAIKRHTDYILPPSAGRKPVTMRIMVLSANEQPNNGYEKATVTVVTSFEAKSGDGGSVEIYRTSATVSESGNDATSIYERLIRRAVEECLEQLNSKDIDKLTADASAIKKLKKEETRARVLPDSINVDQLLNIGGNKTEATKTPESEAPTMPMDKKRKMEEEESYLRLEEMSTLSLLVGTNGSGWTATYYLNSIFADGRISIPLTAGVEYIDNLSSSEAKKYQTSSIYYSKIGAEAFYPINKYFWLNGGVQIPLGTERLADLDGNESETFIAGICLTQSIRVMSNQYSGISLAVGFFEQLTSSKVQPYNVGVRVEFGVKF